MEVPRYGHTQHSRLFLALLALAVFFGSMAFFDFESEEPFVLWLLLAMSLLMLLLSFCFAFLRVEDQGEQLGVRFGPLGVFGTSIRYDEMLSASAARSRLIDGWGIHWIPGRGWTFNLWGFDCVEIRRIDGKLLRVGTDEPAELSRFLMGVIEAGAGAQGEGPPS